MRKTKRKVNPQQSLKDIWYDKLKASGFNDIEYRHQDKLLVFEAHEFSRPRRRNLYYKTQEYQEVIERFANHKDFEWVLIKMTEYPSNFLKPKEIRLIWRLHCEGFSQRYIAAEVGFTQAGISFLLKRMREWMQLIM